MEDENQLTENQVEEKEVEDLWAAPDGWFKKFLRSLGGAGRFFIIVILLGLTGYFAFLCVTSIKSAIAQTHDPKIFLAVFALFWLSHLAIPFLHRKVKRALFAMGILGFGGLICLLLGRQQFVVVFGTQWLPGMPDLGTALGYYCAMVLMAAAGRQLFITPNRDTHQWGPRGLRSLQHVLQRKRLSMVEQVYRKGDTLRLALFHPRSDGNKSGQCELSFLANIEHVAFDFILPITNQDGGIIDLEPQRGVEGNVQSIGEQKTGHEALDALYVIRSDHQDMTLLKRMEKPLRALADLDATILIGMTTLQIQIPQVQIVHLDWRQLLNQIVSLWQRVDGDRAGFDFAAHGDDGDVQDRKILTEDERRITRGRFTTINPVAGFLWVWIIAASLGTYMAYLIESRGDQEAVAQNDGLLWTGWHDNGEKSSEGVYKDGRVYGRWTFWYDNGQKSSEGWYSTATFNGIEHGVREGEWTYWLRTGEKEAYVEFQAGHFSGKARKKNVWGVMGREELREKLITGKYTNGEKDGKWTIWYENGQKQSEGIYKNGKKEGMWTKWRRNGKKVMEGNYIAGNIDGEWTFGDLGMEKRKGIPAPSSYQDFATSNSVRRMLMPSSRKFSPWQSGREPDNVAP